jgi:hypothetical protein
MLHALTLLATSAGSEDETSKTAFYLLGGLLVIWAVVVAGLGMSRSSTFPATAAAKRGVMAITAVLMVGAMATAVITG